MVDIVAIAVTVILTGIGWVLGYRYRHQDKRDTDQKKKDNESPFGRFVSNIH